MYEEPQEDSKLNSTYSIVIASVISLPIVRMVIIISLLLWSRKRKREPELVDNAAYHSHNTEIKTDAITAHTINASFVTANISMPESL